MKKRRTELDLFWRRAGNALSCGERLGQSRDAIGILQRRTLRATAVKQSEWNKSQSARKKELWLYYALMATIGSVIGGYVTYRLARKGGKETVERKFSGRTLDKVYRIFGRWGFGAIAIAALLPPPVPMVPFVFAAGAMQTSSPHRHYWADCSSDRGLHFHPLKETQYDSAHLGDFYARSSHDVSSRCVSSRVRYSCRTTLSRELLMWISPLYSMKPSFLNLFMKKLTRGRVVPIISASISCDTLARTFCG